MGLFSGFLRMLWENEQPHLKVLDDPEAFARNYRVFFRAMGERDEFFSVFEEDDRLLASKGVQVMRKVYDGKHEWQVWRECARDFLPAAVPVTWGNGYGKIAGRAVAAERRGRLHGLSGHRPERAYIDDTGMGRPPLMPQIRALTGLAVDLLLTHAHPDHFGAAGEFERIWLCADDRETLACSEPLCHRFGVPTLPVQRVRFFRDGDSFDAGGIRLEALQLPGHTPGSCVFGVPEWKELFTGDAIGSGDIVLMTLPGALSVSAYCASLEHFVQRAGAYADTEWRGGHCSQAGIPGTPAYNPPRHAGGTGHDCPLQTAAGRATLRRTVREPNAPGGHALRARWGTAGMVYTAVE